LDRFSPKIENNVFCPRNISVLPSSVIFGAGTGFLTAMYRPDWVDLPPRPALRLVSPSSAMGETSRLS